MSVGLLTTSTVRSAWPWVALAAALITCHATPLQGVGRSTDTPAAPASRAATLDAAAPTSPIPADFADHLARVGPDSFVSRGHAGGRYAVTVDVTPEAKDAVHGAGADFAAGTEIVMTSLDRKTRGQGPTYFMQKAPLPPDAAGGSWRFGIVEDPAAPAEDLALCARCHEEAPNDHVFRLPE